VRQFKKPNPQTAYLVLPTHKPRLKKPKELFFENAQQRLRIKKMSVN